MFEKRTFFRRNIEIAVKYLPEKDKSTLMASSHSKNISAGGLCLLINELYPINTKINLRFCLPNTNEIFDLNGYVTWTKEEYKNKLYHIGIKFANTKHGLIKKINTWCISN